MSGSSALHPTGRGREGQWDNRHEWDKEGERGKRRVRVRDREQEKWGESGTGL